MDLELVMISHQSLNTKGGVSLHLVQLAEAIARLGVELEMVAPASDSVKPSPSFPFRITPIALSSPLVTMRVLEYSQKVCKYMAEREKRPDAIHASQWSSYFLVRNLCKSGVPVVSKFHGTYRYAQLARRQSGALPFPASIRELAGSVLYLHAEKTVAKRSAGIIFISTSVRNEVESITRGHLGKNSRIIYNGVDTRRFRPLNSLRFRDIYGLSSSDSVLVYVGRLDPLKGVDRLILVARRLMSKYSHLKVFIAGTGEQTYTDYLASIAKPRENFIFAGWVDQDKLAEIYAMADVVVAPSNYAAGNNVLEAMACGKPVVVVPGSGFPELVKHQQTGFVVNGVSLESCLGLLLEGKKDALGRVGKAAREFVERNLTWEKTAIRTIEFLQRTIEQRENTPT